MLITLLSTNCIPISADIITEAYEVTLRIVGDEAKGVQSLARPDVGEQVLRTLALGRE
jgi:exosome complex component RRP4